ncbi:MAG: hypothetical protein PHD65_05400 [Gallionella sp.]|nr:hypothetical protein [Gallionella sp.]
MVDLDNFKTLLSGFGQEKLCQMLEVNPKTVKRWADGTIEAPKAVRLLLHFINWGDLSAIGGEEWEGFTINMKDHRLTVPFFHRDFGAKEISAMFFTTQDAWQDKRDLKRISEELTTTRLQLEKTKTDNAFYRSQLKQANREFVLKN